MRRWYLTYWRHKNMSDEQLPTIRSENEILSDLKKICTSPGYAHAIAYFCFRDNIIKYKDKVTYEEISHQYSRNFLVRNEISTLIGFMVQKDIDLIIPTPEKFTEYIETTESHLNELHHSLMAPFQKSIIKAIEEKNDFNPFASGGMLREPIFYGGESAYNFQYRDFSLKKYLNDNHWFIANKGFSIEQAISLIVAISEFQNQHTMEILDSMRNKDPSEWTILPGFTFSIDDISSFIEMDIGIIKNIIEAFTIPNNEKNVNFRTLNDFNITNAYPIIKINNEYLLFQIYSLTESLYDTPFYWFLKDKNYYNTAMKNRGDFTENISAERLISIFGQNRVFKNVNIVNSHKDRAGEIDVLVVFANRAIVLQAKSKKLTIESRKGNDQCIKNDFKKSIQDSYDQGLSCAKFLNDKKYFIRDQNDEEIKIQRNFKEIYIFCILSDHYPALSFQAKQFLKYETSDIIKPPFIMDIFYLDVMAEMLNSPLYFLSYINRRTEYSERIDSMNELTILSYHLKKNLWIDGEYDFVHLDDSIAADLDVAMLARREGLPGKTTPDGILTHIKGSVAKKIIEKVENYEHPGTIDFGFLILGLSGEGINDLNRGIEHLAKLTKKDHHNHDFSLVFSDLKNGVTIHCNYDPKHIASPRLHDHCTRRKYVHHADEWFGICIDPTDFYIKFGIELQYEWRQSQRMDLVVRGMKQGFAPQEFEKALKKNKKVGRNDPCPCGSGKKYKKCCLK